MKGSGSAPDKKGNYEPSNLHFSRGAQQPSMYLESIRFCRTSSSTLLELLHDRTISAKMLESLARGLLRGQVGAGAYGIKQQAGQL